MFIAHLPAGYILGSHLSKKVKTKGIMPSVLFGSIFPDIDMFWFYLIDNRQTHHHDYYTHWPIFYVGALLVSALVYRLNKRVGALLAAFATGGILHMVLDSFVSRMHWLRPFSELYYVPIEVRAKYSYWVWNFILHWWFAVEVIICLVAFTMLFRKMNKTH